MSKYDLAFKLAVVKAYLAGEGGYNYLANKFGIPSKTPIINWVKAYDFFGESGLERRKSHKTYSIQFKLDALHYKLNTGEPYQSVAFKFGIHESSIVANWMYVWQKEGIEKGSPNQRGVQLCQKRKISQIKTLKN